MSSFYIMLALIILIDIHGAVISIVMSNCYYESLWFGTNEYRLWSMFDPTLPRDAQSSSTYHEATPIVVVACISCAQPSKSGSNAIIL